MANQNLSNAKNTKNDEFYTQYADIQKEMNAYLVYNPDVFRGKTILLPCDDPEWSNFTKFFAQNFERFGLKKLISTSYAPDSKKYKYGYPCWYTNIEHGRRHQPLPLMTMEENIKFSKHKEIRERGYQQYDNYDAIEVPFTDAIPSDYKDVMGVPISFLDKYCPEQFEIVNANDYRRTDKVPIKAHGLMKDKEAAITTFN